MLGDARAKFNSHNLSAEGIVRNGDAGPERGKGVK